MKILTTIGTKKSPYTMSGAILKTLTKDHDRGRMLGTETMTESAWKSSVAPNTTKHVRPKYSNKHRKFYCNLEKNTLNKLVKECFLVDNEGNMIQEADARNPRDKFFNHPEMTIKVREGELSLDPTIPIEKIKIAILEDSPYVATSGKDKTMISRFLLSDYKSVQEELGVRVTRKEKAWKLFFKSNLASKRLFAESLGLKTNKDTSQTIIDNHLKKQIETNIGAFLEVAELSKEDLTIQSLFNKGKQAKHITRRQGHWHLFGNKIARTTLEVIEYLKRDNNQEDYERLEKLTQDV